MGPGMAAVLARYGSTVRLYDVSAEALERAQAATSLASGILDRLEVAGGPGGLISYETDLGAALADVEFVLEAAPERLEIKRELFAQFEASAPDGAILATNTSGIPVTEIARGLEHPERVIGMHWSNPPHLIPMIEVVPGTATADRVRDAVVELVADIGYEAVVEREVPGFVENRILYAILRECLSLVERGIVSQSDMDTCVRWGIGFKLAVVGPMRLLDMAGLDIYESVASYLNADLASTSEVASFITERTSAGHLGMKTREGVYSYSDEAVAEERARIAAGLVAVRRALSNL